MSVAGTPCTFSPNSIPGQKLASYLSSTHFPPGTAMSTSRSLSDGLLCSVSVRKAINEDTNSGAETCQSLVSAERKCKRVIDSLKQTNKQKWLMWLEWHSQGEQLRGDQGGPGWHTQLRPGQGRLSVLSENRDQCRPHSLPLQGPWLGTVTSPG